MGVDVDIVVMIGISFPHQEEANNYAIEKLGIPREVVEADGLREAMYDFGGLDWEEEKGYADRGGVIGVVLEENSLNHTANGVTEAWDLCYEMFPKEDHDKIKPYIWAQYW